MFIFRHTTVRTTLQTDDEPASVSQVVTMVLIRKLKPFSIGTFTSQTMPHYFTNWLIKRGNTVGHSLVQREVL